MSITTHLTTIRSIKGHGVRVGYDFRTVFDGLVARDEADVAIVSTEDGYSPLGASRSFLQRDLGISYDGEIRRLAQWNRSENPRVTLVALASRNPQGRLRGVILAPGSNTLSYGRFGHSTRYARPHRDYYYNISYEAFAYASLYWGARKLAISHLSGSGAFHWEMPICHAEALSHFCDEHPEAVPTSLVFCGCCMETHHFREMTRLFGQAGESTSAFERTRHRPIRVEQERLGDAILLHLDWPGSNDGLLAAAQTQSPHSSSVPE